MFDFLLFGTVLFQYGISYESGDEYTYWNMAIQENTIRTHKQVIGMCTKVACAPKICSLEFYRRETWFHLIPFVICENSVNFA